MREDFWKADLSKCSVVTLYGINEIMSRASDKLQETAPGVLFSVLLIFVRDVHNINGLQASTPLVAN